MPGSCKSKVRRRARLHVWRWSRESERYSARAQTVKKQWLASVVAVQAAVAAIAAGEPDSDPDPEDEIPETIE